MSYLQNQCWACDGAQEGKWGFGGTQDLGCIVSETNKIYPNQRACEEQNNARMAYVNPETCLVFFNDNGKTYKNASNVDMLKDQYPSAAAAALQQLNPLMTGLTIPTSADQSNPIYNFNSQGQQSWLQSPQSRLWAYDLTGNTLFYVDKFNHEGSDIGMSESNMWVGCQYNLGLAPYGGQVIGVFTVNEYGYNITNNEVSTFSKTPQKVYRFVNTSGALITASNAKGPSNSTPANNGNNMSAATNSDVATGGLGLGQSMTAIDDRTIIFDDRNSSGLYVADLDELWTGSTVNSPSMPTNTSGAVDADGNNYLDLSTHTYNPNTRSLTDAYYHCSQGTDYRIYTVVCRPLINLRSGNSLAYTQGDAAFVPTDPVFGGDPSVVVTFYSYTSGDPNSGLSNGCVQNPGTSQTGNFCNAKVARWKLPTTTQLAQKNWPIQQYSDRVTSSSAVTGVDQFTTPGSVALISDVATGQYYSTTGRFRWNFDKTTLSASNPTQMTITTYDLNGIQTNQLWQSGGGFRGAAQVPSCVTSSAYTWNCGLNGCSSTLGSGGMYSALTACTEACISWSCQTSCVCPSGYTLNSVTKNCEALATPITNTGLAVTSVSPASTQGQNGTRLCLDLGCTTYVDKVGPNLGGSTSLENGFWGQTGSYLDNGRLNYTGVWPGSTNPSPAGLETTNENDIKWYGITRCITVPTDSTYLIGVGAMNHFRVSIDSVIKLDTTTGVNGFDPANITGANTILNPATETLSRWWVIPFVLSAGTHTINIEGASVDNNGGLGTEIVGPFTASTAFTTTNSLTALTYSDYTTNTIFSTADLQGVQSSSSCDLSLPTFPLAINSFDSNALPGPQMETAYPNPWGTTNSAPIGGSVNGIDCISPYTYGFGVLDNGNSLTPSQRWLMAFADNTLLYNGQNVNTMYFSDFLFDWTLWSPCQGTGAGYSCDAAGNLLPLPNGGDYCYTPNASCSPTEQGAYKRTFDEFYLHGFKKTGVNSTSQMTNTADDGTGTYTSQQNTAGQSPKFKKWTDFVDWLNANGLVQSSVPDPGTSNYPMVDYNATYWQVVYASLDYWTAADTRPNPGQNQLEWEGFGISGLQFKVQSNYPCVCSLNSSGYFDTQVNQCPDGFIYDGCQNTCVSVTGCTLGQVTPGFTGGCASIVGTGATNTFITYSGCNIDCGSASTITFYDCGTSACVQVGNGVTGTTGAYTSLTECQETCSTWNCQSTGCVIQNGSGGTYTSESNCLSSGACQSYNCTSFGGCQVQNGTGGTYTNNSLCVTACTSYECLANGCQSYPGSGHTFSAESACTATCVSYECTTDCCQPYNTPYYGTGGTYSAESACTPNCVSWNCENDEFVAADATIYAFYDTSSFQNTMIQSAVLALSAWTMTIPGFTGQVHHGFYSQEKWLKWAASPWNGLTGGTQGQTPQNLSGGPCRAGMMHKWNVDNGWNASFWDNGIIGDNFTNCNGQSNPLTSTNGTVIKQKGTAPTATTTDSVLVIIFVDESENEVDNSWAYHQKQIAPSSSTTPQFIMGMQTAAKYKPDQPSAQWKRDYTAFTNTYATLTGATGQYPANNKKWFVYPNKSTVGVNGYIGDYNRNLVLNVVASIDSGNKVPVDGTWVTDTAPRRATSFPNPPTVHNGYPVQLSNAANLTALETSNPYYTEGYGNLDSYGFSYNVSFNAFSPTAFIADLTTVLSGGSSGGTVCTSACTSPTQQYPFTAFSQCVTACTKYNCTNTGCVPVSATSATTGLYDSLDDCTGGTFTTAGVPILQPCTSYNCGNSGCTIYNSPNFGSGGTFTTNIHCMSGCVSYECTEASVLVSPTTQGCQQTVGSGGTFYNIDLSLAYASCTGSCKSWECTNPCSGGTSGTSSCTEYPNTGMTFSSVTACTGSCVANWYCVPGYTVEDINCSGRTLVDLGGIMGVPISDIGLPTGPSVNAIGLIGNPNSGLQFTNFSTMKFEFGSSSTQSNHPCVGPNGYDIGYIHSIQGNGNVLRGGNPGSNVFYSWDSLIYAYSAMGLAVDFQTTYEDLLSWPPGVGGINLIGPISYNTCDCIEYDCSIQCESIGNQVPLTYIGPFATSGDAYNSCCAVTYNCVPEQILDTCDSKILIPGIYPNVVDAFEWVSTHLPNTSISTLKWETNAAPNSQLSGCTGLNGGLVASFDVLSYSLLNSGTDYTVWNTFIGELIGDGLTGITSGMSFQYVQSVLESTSGSSINMCANKCYCETIACYCNEIEGSGGTYTSYSECITGCCPSTLLDSTWNCVNSGPYQPVCNTRPYIGLFNTPWAELDWFRTGAPTTSFDTNKFVHAYDVNNNLNSLIRTQSWINNAFSSSIYGWEDCYKAISDDAMNVSYYPYTYVTTISHPMLSGSSYSTYQTFYNDAVAAGVTGIAISTMSGLCEEIGVQLAPNLYNPNNNGCIVTTKQCCNEVECYCYELWFSAGTYLNSSSCLSACCDNTGWQCRLDGSGQNSCVPGAIQNATPINKWFVTQADCQTSLVSGLMPVGGYYLNTWNGQNISGIPHECLASTGVTTWNCLTASTIDTCDTSLGEFQQVCPGTLGNQSGVPYQACPGGCFHYPFSSSSGVIGSQGTGQVEEIFTDMNFWDPAVPFTAATWQYSDILPVTNQCLGYKFNNPLFKMISIANTQVNGGTPYPSWQTFVDAAVIAGYNLTTSQNASNSNICPTCWISVVEPCMCGQVSGCTCVEVVGTGGQYMSEPMCLQYCCNPVDSWDCTPNGCLDPQDGSGTYSGPQGYNDCVNDCWEWECETGGIISDTCGAKIDTGIFSNSMYDQLEFMGDPLNGLQSSNFSNYKMERVVGNYLPNWPYCDGPNASPTVGNTGYMFLFLATSKRCNGCPPAIPAGIGANYNVYNWADLITHWQSFGALVNLQMTGQQALQYMKDNHNVGCSLNGGTCQCTSTPCDCTHIVGTGHTGTYPNTQYNQCVSGCCDGDVVILSDCAIFINDKNEGVYLYDMVNNNTTLLFTDPGFTDYDIANHNNKLWIYNQTIIREYDITFPNFSYTWNRDIQVGIQLGRGLVAKTGNQLLSAGDTSVNHVDISGPIASVTPLFNIPGGMNTIGDIYYDTVSNQILVIYGDYPVNNSSGPMKIGRFDYSGNLLEEFDTWQVIQFVNNERFEGIFCDNGTLFTVTNKGRVFEILTQPLQIAFIPTQTITSTSPIIDIMGATSTTGQKQPCLCSLVNNVPTWDCKSGTASNICVPNNNGTGAYTSLVSCQQQCGGVSGVTWDCTPGGAQNTCSGATQYLPYPLVGGVTAAWEYISLNSSLWSLNTSVITYSEGSPVYQACFSPDALPLYRVTHVSCPSLNGGQQYTSWFDFVMAAHVEGIGQIPLPTATSCVDFGHMLAAMNGYFNLNYSIQMGASTPCQCSTAPCSCDPVIGLGGQYPTQMDCITNCCGPDTTGWDCWAPGQTCLPCYINCDYPNNDPLNQVPSQYTNALAWCNDECGIVTEGYNCDFGQCFYVQNQVAAYTSYADCVTHCQTTDNYYDCVLPGPSCVGLVNNVVGPYLTYQDCQRDCGENNQHDCWKCCRDLTTGYISQLSLQAIPCACPKGSAEVNCNGEPGHGCVKNVSCAQGYVWSWLYCQCVCEQNVSCAAGYVWNSLSCGCIQKRQGPIDVMFIGTQAEVSVKISDYKAIDLPTVTSTMSKAMNDLEEQVRGGIVKDSEGKVKARCTSCGGTSQAYGSCLQSGCLTMVDYKFDDSDIVQWTTTENKGTKSFDCINGVCVSAKDGMFTSLTKCLSECDSLGSKGGTKNLVGKKTNVSIEGGISRSEGGIPEAGPSGIYYSCGIETNSLVGEQQKACIPSTSATAGGYSTLEECLNSGCAGFMTANAPLVSVNGLTLTDTTISPIPMCCEGWINASTSAINVENCKTNCCDGTQTWFPLYNIMGDNAYYDSTIAYLTRELVPLVNNGTISVSNSKEEYMSKGYSFKEVYSGTKIPVCLTNIIGYTNEKPCYSTIVAALTQASVQSCVGYSTTQINGITCYTACNG